MRMTVASVGCVFALALPLVVHAAEPPASRAGARTPAQPRDLDLATPQITQIFSLEQIDAVLRTAVDPALEHIEVQAPRIGDLALEDNSASTAEVVFKSIVQWLAPAQSYAARVNLTPDATAPLRPAPMMASNYHASFMPPASQR